MLDYPNAKLSTVAMLVCTFCRPSLILIGANIIRTNESPYRDTALLRSFTANVWELLDPCQWRSTLTLSQRTFLFSFFLFARQLTWALGRTSSSKSIIAFLSSMITVRKEHQANSFTEKPTGNTLFSTF